MRSVSLLVLFRLFQVSSRSPSEILRKYANGVWQNDLHQEAGAQVECLTDGQITSACHTLGYIIQKKQGTTFGSMAKSMPGSMLDKS